MKKLINLTLFALLLTTINPADAKRMVRTSTSGSAANILQVSKKAEENPTTANKAKLEAALNKEANTKAKQETIELDVRKAQLVAGITLVNQRIKDLNYGWFGFGTDENTQKAHAAAYDRLMQLKNELKTVEAKLSANKKETGSAWAAAVDYAIKTAKYIGLPTIVVGGITYYLYSKGYGATLKGYIPERFGGTRGSAHLEAQLTQQQNLEILEAQLERQRNLEEQKLIKQIRSEEGILPKIKRTGQEFRSRYLPERFGGAPTRIDEARLEAQLARQRELETLETAKLLNQINETQIQKQQELELLEGQLEQQRELEIAKLREQQKHKDRLKARQEAQQKRFQREQQLKFNKKQMANEEI